LFNTLITHNLSEVLLDHYSIVAQQQEEDKATTARSYEPVGRKNQDSS